MRSKKGGDFPTLVCMSNTTLSPPAVRGLDDPRALLQYLYGVAVQRALPLHNTAAFLPPPPKAARWCWALARRVVPWHKR